LLPLFSQNILYKILFVTNFVRNTYKFYNFVENNYPHEGIIYQLIFLKKMTEKNIFFKFF